MPEWFDNLLYGATLPFRAVAEVALAVPSITSTVISETLYKIADSDHEWDPTRDYKEVRGIWGKIANISLSAGAIAASGGVGLVVAGAAAINCASNMNQKCEKILSGNCSSLEERNLRFGIAVDGFGILGSSAKIGMNGLGLSRGVMRSIKLGSGIIGVPLGGVMKFTPEEIANYQRMTPQEKAMEAADLGISIYKFEISNADRRT